MSAICFEHCPANIAGVPQIGDITPFAAGKYELPSRTEIPIAVNHRPLYARTMVRYVSTERTDVHHTRWKKFFCREMRRAEGVYIGKSPVCDVCPDFGECHGTEDHG